MTKAMRVVAIRSFGDVDVFADETWQVPEPRPHEVRVRIQAASFNPIDVYWRAGRLGGQLPVVLGRDFAGTVDALGDEVEDLTIGDAVWGYQAGLATNGTYAEYTCLPAGLVGKRPSSLSMEFAAALPVVGLTALKCVAKTHVQPGQPALVAGGSGGVGAMIVQILRLASSSPIVATAGSDRSVAYLRDQLGLDQDWILRYLGLSTEEILREAVRKNSGNLFPAAFDTVGGAMKRLCFDAVEVDGHVVTIVEEPQDFSLNLWDERTSPLSSKSLSFHFVELGARARLGPRKLLSRYRDELDWLADHAQSGKLVPPPVRVMGALSADTAREAHSLLQTGHPGGKLVMTID